MNGKNKFIKQSSKEITPQNKNELLFLSDIEIEKIFLLLEEIAAARKKSIGVINNDKQKYREILGILDKKESEIKELTRKGKIKGYRVVALNSSYEIDDEIEEFHYFSLDIGEAKKWMESLYKEPMDYVPKVDQMNLYGRALIEIEATQCEADPLTNNSLSGLIVSIGKIISKKEIGRL